MATIKRATNQLQERLRREAQSEIIRRILAERHLHDFVVQAWPQIFPDERFVDGWHIAAICQHLEAVVDGRIKQLLINVPPGTMKSLLLSVFCPAWTWTTRPFKKFMFASYSDYLTMRDSVRCRDLVTSEWYQKRWPLELKDDSNSKGKWDNTRGGWRLATSIGGRGTGEHPDIKCLLEGTKVRTPNGLKSIEAVQCGDLVWSRDLKTGTDQYKPVISTTRQRNKITIAECVLGVEKSAVKVTTSTGASLRCTTDHLVFSERGYVEAGTLKPGQKIGPADAQVVSKVELIRPPIWVYDIGVADNHNFYADGLLVHNCFDDPHNVTQAESEVERQAVINWWDGTMETRGAMKDSASVGIMQRLHALDLSGHLLEKGGWDHICLPMRYEAPELDEKTGTLVPRMKPTSIGWQDPRTVDGELLWPQGYDEAKVRSLEIKLGLYNAAGQLQQRPTPRGGGAFERAWFKVLLTQPALTRVVRYWDKAGTRNKHGAESAGVAIGEYDDPTATHPAMRTKYLVLHATTFRERAAEREKLIKQTAAVDAAQWGHVETWVEQEPGSGGLESAENTVANLAGFDCKIEKVTGSKEVRAQPLAAQASVGKVSILAGDWNRQFLDEIEQFPLGKLKDLVDAASGAFNKLFTPGGGFSNTEGFRVGQNADVFTPSRLDLWTPEQ